VCNKRHGLEDSDGPGEELATVLRAPLQGGTGGFAPMSAIQALPSASPKADDAFQGSSGRDVRARVELIHFGLDGNIRFLRVPAAWSRR
jgi:hypothetical protein